MLNKIIGTMGFGGLAALLLLLLGLCEYFMSGTP